MKDFSNVSGIDLNSGAASIYNQMSGRSDNDYEAQRTVEALGKVCSKGILEYIIKEDTYGRRTDPG